MPVWNPHDICSKYYLLLLQKYKLASLCTNQAEFTNNVMLLELSDVIIFSMQLISGCRVFYFLDMVTPPLQFSASDRAVRSKHIFSVNDTAELSTSSGT